MLTKEIERGEVTNRANKNINNLKNLKCINITTLQDQQKDLTSTIVKPKADSTAKSFLHENKKCER